jgi:hypothetical protein
VNRISYIRPHWRLAAACPNLTPEANVRDDPRTIELPKLRCNSFCLSLLNSSSPNCLRSRVSPTLLSSKARSQNQNGSSWCLDLQHTTSTQKPPAEQPKRQALQELFVCPLLGMLRAMGSDWNVLLYEVDSMMRLC